MHSVLDFAVGALRDLEIAKVSHPGSGRKTFYTYWKKVNQQSWYRAFVDHSPPNTRQRRRAAERDAAKIEMSNAKIVARRERQKLKKLAKKQAADS